MSRPLILLGAGGHAKVVLDLIRRCGFELLGVCDPALAAARTPDWRGLRVLGDDEAIQHHATDEVLLANGIGSLPGQSLRRQLFERFRDAGYRFVTLVHPQAVLAEGVELEEGAQIMAGAVLQADSRIGDNSIVNTGACIDHDSRIGAHCHIAPGTVLSGGCEIGDRSHLGPGSCVIQGIRIGPDCVVGAGATVLRDLPAQAKLLGPRPASPYLLGRDEQT